MFEFFEKIPKLIIVIISTLFVLIIGLLDYLTGSGFPLLILYFLPITIVAWYVNLKIGILFSLVCLASSIITEMHNGYASLADHVFIINTIKRFLVFLVFVITVNSLKKNFELAARNKLIIQRSRDIIDTSRRTTGIIVENITQYNLELLHWINKQEENGQHVPEIIKSTNHNIGVSLRALSEASFSEIEDDKGLDVEDFIDLLQKKIKEASNRIFHRSKS